MLATPLETATLPPGIRSRFVRGVNGLDIHILEAGYAPAGRPLVLLLHGFPEIAYSWRKVMPALAEAGFHAVAPDQRGYRRNTGWSPDFDTDLRPWRTLNAVRDALGLVAALKHRSIHAVVGNDFGADDAVWRTARPAVRHRREGRQRTLTRLYGHDARSAITGITLIAGFASTIGWPLS